MFTLVHLKRVGSKLVHVVIECHLYIRAIGSVKVNQKFSFTIFVFSISVLNLNLETQVLIPQKNRICQKNNNRTVQAQSSKFASLLFDQGFQIVIPPRSPANVPGPIGTPSDGILHPSDCCLLRQCFQFSVNLFLSNC